MVGQNFVRVHDPVGVEQALDLPHGGDGLGALGEVHEVALLEPEAVLGADAAPAVYLY